MSEWLKNIGFIALMLASFAVGLRLNIARQLGEVRVDTVTIRRDSVVHDTICIARPVSVDRVVTDTLFKTIRDTILVALPITQQHYKDSLYEAWVSGYEAKLDSIRVHARTRYVYIEKKVQPRRPKVVISVGMYGGVGIRSPDVGVGISVGVPLWWW